MIEFFEEYFQKFPEAWQFKIGDSVDIAVKSFAFENQGVLKAIKEVVINSVGAIHWALETIP